MWEDATPCFYSAEKLGNFAAPIVTAPAYVGLYTLVSDAVLNARAP
jgi:hypothetical protein